MSTETSDTGGDTTTVQTGAEQAPEGGGEVEAGQGNSLEPVLERLNELGSQMGETRSLLDALRQPEQEQQAEQQPEGFDGLLDGEGYLDMEKLQGRMDSLVEQRINSALEQDRARLSHVQDYLLDQEFDALETQYPELKDEQKATALMESVKRFAADRGIPGLAQDPEFIEAMYLAGRARELGSQQVAAGSDQEVSLEGGSGANQRAGATSDDEIKAGIRGVGGSSDVWGR